MLKTLKKIFTPPNVDFTTATRNEPCPCGSGKKYKQCHWTEIQRKQREERHARQFQNPRG